MEHESCFVDHGRGADVLSSTASGPADGGSLIRQPESSFGYSPARLFELQVEVFALREDANGSLYGLDDQALARQFPDKEVAVTGSLDKAATIDVKSIEEQKA